MARRVVPTAQEKEEMIRLSEKLREKVQEILETTGLEGDVSIEGSVARDTWIRGEADLDIFMRFSPKIERLQWTGKIFPAIRKELNRYRIVERFAEHPYLEFTVDDTRVNVVPCYAVEKGKWLSATDRTPYHTGYMKENLTPELRLEARLLKRFMKGISTYGAEIKIGGFSGMLVETLILHFRTFLETLKQASRWKPGSVIDLEQSYKGRLDELARRFESPLVVVDPVDPNRNLAAAVRRERLWSFVAAGREFLSRPSISFFYPPKDKPKTRNQILKQLQKPGHDIAVVLFPHPSMVLDVLWGQLFRLERAVVNLMVRHEFQVLRSRVWSDEEEWSALLIEVDRAFLPSLQIHRGPPVSRREECQAFLERHLGAKDTVRGPWLDGDRWIVEKRREIASIGHLLKVSLRHSRSGLAIPKQLEEGFRRRVRVLLNKEIVSLVGKAGFNKALWEFLDGKPTWLGRTRASSL